MTATPIRRLLPTDAPREAQRLEKARVAAEAAVLELLAAVEAAQLVIQPVMAEPPTQLLTLEQAAQELGCGVTFVKGLIRRGALVSVHLGDLHKVEEREIARYVQELRG